MATKNTAAAATAATAAKAAPAPAPVAPAAPVAVAPQAPLYTCQPYSAATGQGWPAKATGGNTVRAYCYTVAMALAKAQPQGFTLAQYASALAANAATRQQAARAVEQRKPLPARLALDILPQRLFLGPQGFLAVEQGQEQPQDDAHHERHDGDQANPLGELPDIHTA